MKLQYQLTAAFTTLLIIIMSAAAITTYSLILNVLIQDEQRQLKDNGRLILEFMVSEDLTDVGNAQQLLKFLEEYNLQVFYYDEKSNTIMYPTVPVPVIKNWINTYDLSDPEQPLWKAGDDRYVVSIIPIYPDLTSQVLVLLTPLDDLQEVQQTFLKRLIVVFLIGIVLAVLLSYYLTKRLVTPLTKLKLQLKKIEKRQFDNIEEIEATGEIKEVEQSVIEMANELQRYIKSQRQFFQNASHELKTPLMTIQGYAEGIRDGIFVDEDSERGLKVMVDEVARLKKIINEMILLAKLDSEENIYQEELINIEELIKLTLDRALPLANERGISLSHRFEPGMKLYADTGKILQAMMNIVSNGIRHAKTTVHLHAYSADGSVIITIEDDGEGIDDELMPKLFHRFVKGNGGETGLGLAISRAIVERSNGSIRVGRSDLGGARFTIKF
ncbi:sensor histidine kinase [Aquibacillus kalidii]|uniref:sensor histidine kinase n=1 Tax=Aquibacillus kalidii TaxID=2762597 RepID=UPI001644618E|nr:HAMP domain-containing sensor histidine kinase [Aquibacillus kalidii]